VKKQNDVEVASEEYFYDSAGQRFLVVDHDRAAESLLTWTIGDVEAHYDDQGSLTHVYSHISLGTPVARVKRTASSTTDVELQFHGLASHTIAAVDIGGTVNAAFSCIPFGEVVEASGTQAQLAVHRRRFNDKQHDPLTGLAYYGHRFYDRVLLGWTQADPLYLRVPDAALLSTPRRASIYTFSLQNPLRYLDPDGLDPREPKHTATMCMPSATGNGCAIDGGGGAAYDGEKTWAATGQVPLDAESQQYAADAVAAMVDGLGTIAGAVASALPSIGSHSVTQLSWVFGSDTCFMGASCSRGRSAVKPGEACHTVKCHLNDLLVASLVVLPATGVVRAVVRGAVAVGARIGAAVGG
jgi:RHS repeat-associated protein